MDIIRETAARHETTADRILAGDRAAETVEARREAVRLAAAAPKPTGRQPMIREVARWFGLNPSSVSEIVKGQ